MNQDTRRRIIEHISPMMDRLIQRRVYDEPFDGDLIRTINPFGARLVPEEVWKGSRFERSFVTILGQGIFEQIAQIIAEGTGAYASNQHDVTVHINTWKVEQIERILREHRNGGRRPNWVNELNEVRMLQNENYTDVNLRFDLYIRRADGIEEFYGLKTVKPNLDQTERAKRDMLLLSSVEDVETYFVLPFNPAGEGMNYRLARHAVPYRIFNMDTDPSVLIGAEFWNKVGDDDNTYAELLDIFEELGDYYSEVIRREYFNL